MGSNNRNPARRAAGRASELFSRAIERSEDTQALNQFQASHLARRLGLAPSTARMIAGLAFPEARP